MVTPTGGNIQQMRYIVERMISFAKRGPPKVRDLYACTHNIEAVYPWKKLPLRSAGHLESAGVLAPTHTAPAKEFYLLKDRDVLYKKFLVQYWKYTANI